MTGRAGLKAVALTLLAGAMSASPGSARMAHPHPAPAAGSAAPRTGLTCAWTMLRTSAAVGRRCGVREIPGLLGTLDHNISRMEDHVRGTEPAFVAQMEERRRQLDGQPAAQLCTAEAMSSYAEMEQGEPEALRDLTDQVIAEPGPPEWGECS
jgi:hypothetical protein